jgi:adenosylcobinamide-GDP ribazoletransferase
MTRIIVESRAAIGLLTRIPVARRSVDRPGAAAFAVVGAGIAALAAVPFLALGGPAREPLLAAIAAVAVIVVLTGAMHLDGLADTADALVAPDRAAAERARKDPAVGPGGVVAVVLVVAGEVAALASLASTADPATAAWTLVAAAGVARSVPVFLARSLGSAHGSAGLDGSDGSDGSDGLGAWFASHVTFVDAAVASATVALLVGIVAVATTPLIAAATVVGGVIGMALGRAVVARRGGLDGDAFGASVELTFVAILATVAVVV